jgi:glycosyltransferase involved in cell wall biosynthesis
MSDASNGAGRALVSVVVPVFNESATVGQIVAELLALELHFEILLVDDGSTDASPAVLAQLAERHTEVKVLTQPQNRGKGAAVRRGISESTGDFLLIQDADLEYSPSDIPALIDPLLSGKADAVFGTRLRGGAHPQRAHLFWHYAGNRFLTLLANVLYNTTISDMEVGYKAFRGDLVRDLTLVSNDFRIEPELTAKVLRLGPDIRLFEVPISYYGRSYAEGKKITWRDGFGAVGALIRFRFF